jgi:hypothetical protein
MVLSEANLDKIIGIVSFLKEIFFSGVARNRIQKGNKQLILVSLKAIEA